MDRSMNCLDGLSFAYDPLLKSTFITLHAVVILFLMVLLFNVGVIMVNLFDYCTSYRFREPIKPCYQYQETWRP